jgi:hypothetical protein
MPSGVYIVPPFLMVFLKINKDAKLNGLDRKEQG